MPFAYELTWMPRLNKWRKRYKQKDYFMKTKVSGKRDRPGYLAALREWERLKAYLDGVGYYPYRDGELVPEEDLASGATLPPPPPAPPQPVQSIGQTPTVSSVPRSVPQTLMAPAPPDWILGVGFGQWEHPEQVVRTIKNHPYSDERRINALANAWLRSREKSAKRGELSLKQYAEDRAKLQTFRDFVAANYPDVHTIDEIDPPLLNLYRDKQWELVESGDYRISKATLKKRLDTLKKWLGWLVDENILAELPKDLSNFAKVKLDKPKLLFWTPDDVKELTKHATPRTKLYIRLALNLGYTQKDISTLTYDMIDWKTGIVTRDRHKTNVPCKAKLWGSTLKLLKSYRSRRKAGPLLLAKNGNPLYSESINDKGSLIVNDSIRLAFDRLKKSAGFENDPRSFKHLRKSAANEIEKVAPDLTESFLAHAEKKTKRHYVEQHFENLYAQTQRLEILYGFAKQTIKLLETA